MPGSWRTLTRLAAIAACLAASLTLAGCATPRVTAADEPLIRGRTFVVTGASSGFGRGAAIQLAGHGGNVVLAARRASVLAEVAAQAQAAGGQALVVPTDVSRPEDVERLAAAAERRFGRIDAWINDAGVVAIGPFDTIPVRDHARLIDVNLKGYIYGSHAALTRFRAQGYGTLVNVGSVESELPLAYQASYTASKAAILAMDRAINQELRLQGASRIRVSTVMPWAADTPIWDHAANYSGHTARIRPMDDPGSVVDAIVWAAVHPRDEVPVGVKAVATVAAHRLAPGLTERLAADVGTAELQRGAPLAATSGTLFRPMPEGTGVEGGVRARMAEEDRRQDRRQACAAAGSCR